MLCGRYNLGDLFTDSEKADLVAPEPNEKLIKKLTEDEPNIDEPDTLSKKLGKRKDEKNKLRIRKPLKR